MIHRRSKSRLSNDYDGNKTTSLAEKEGVCVNETKLGALLFFPLVGIALTTCLGDMWHRNSTMHREPNTARALLVNCPAKDPDHVWWWMVVCYLMVMASIAVLTRTMLGWGLSETNFNKNNNNSNSNSNNNNARSKSTCNRVFTCRVCLFLFFWGFYNWDVCMGTMPYLKKASTQIYFAALIFFICSPTLSMPLIVLSDKPSKSSSPLLSYKQRPSCWPLFLIKLMVFILYADAGWHKFHHNFTNTVLRSQLVQNWIFYERPTALLLLDQSWFTAVSAHATLLCEGFGWLLVCLGFDSFAALLMMSFHVGIYLAMNIDFITFWCCSFVFFFVPLITSSNRVQQQLLQLRKEKSVLVELPLGCSRPLELDVVKYENAAVNEGSNPKLKQRKRKSSMLLAVLCVVAFTYKGFYPHTMMLPGVMYTRDASLLSRLYEQVSGMSFKPFNTFDMYTSGSFPIKNRVIHLILKEQPDGKNKRVKFIPHRGSDFYLYSNMLKRVDGVNKDDTVFTLRNNKNDNSKEEDITRCNIFACIAKQFILSDSIGTFRESKDVDSAADIQSIEIVEEVWSDQPTRGVSKSRHSIFGHDTGYGSVQIVGSNSPLERQVSTLCSLDIDIDIGRGNSSKEREQQQQQQYEDGTCGTILAELDAKARSYHVPEGIDIGTNNPFYMIPVKSRTVKYLYRSDDDKIEVPVWIVLIVMLFAGYKTYLLAR